jgi:hypothetical protein
MISKFASWCGGFVCELRNRKTQAKPLIQRGFGSEIRMTDCSNDADFRAVAPAVYEG